MARRHNVRQAQKVQLVFEGFNGARSKFPGMQRVRIGLTGLAFVFVLVLLAAVFSDPSDEELITANLIELGSGATPPEKAEPKEPLAELGVAPGNSDTNTASADADQAAGNPRR